MGRVAAGAATRTRSGEGCGCRVFMMVGEGVLSEETKLTVL